MVIIVPEGYSPPKKLSGNSYPRAAPRAGQTVLTFQNARLLEFGQSPQGHRQHSRPLNNFQNARLLEFGQSESHRLVGRDGENGSAGQPLTLGSPDGFHIGPWHQKRGGFRGRPREAAGAG
jgi:hypothetical protein